MAEICLVACHGGAANHMALYSEALSVEGYAVKIYGAGAALESFKKSGVACSTFTKDQEGLEHLIEKCKGAALIITDLGDPFDVEIHQGFKERLSAIPRAAYYDNPEQEVPGEYGVNAKRVHSLANYVLFANSNLATGDSHFGIGYYPESAAKKIAQRREDEAEKMRTQFFGDHKIEDKGQQLLVYVGGNNSEYFDKAFPAFLRMISSDLSDSIIVLQQHPGAKKENKDRNALELWQKGQADGPQLLVSQWNSSDVQVVAGKMLYYQTSMAPQFALAGIPTIQVGHEVYDDLLVRERLCLVATSGVALCEALKEDSTLPSAVTIKKGLGMDDHWEKRLVEAVQKITASK